MDDPRIKICGITSPQDARACFESGADLLGVIFAKSPRRVTRDSVREIREAVPSAALVGVFAGAPFNDVIETAKHTGVDMIQLHGQEPPSFCEDLGKVLALPVIRAFQYNEALSAGLPGAFASTDYYLLDLEKGISQAKEAAARTELWELARRLDENQNRLFLAGGLDPDNVRRAVNETRPFAVDVCRGVERTPGQKDLQKVKRFITEVKQCRSMKP